MTSTPLLAHDRVICWVNVWLAPIEYAFDVIELELDRQGGGLDGVEPPSLSAA